MAELSSNDRAVVAAEFSQEVSLERETCSEIKANIRAAVDGLDTWLNDNAASANAAIPQPARTNLTIAQKARLLRLVITRRYISGA